MIIQIVELLMYACLIGIGVGITLLYQALCEGYREIEKWYNEYHHPANTLMRAKERMVSKHWEALEEFKSDIRKVTRR